MRKLMLSLLALAGGGLWHYARHIEPDALEINPITLTLPNLAAEFDGYRILQVSDIHRNAWMTPERLNAWMQRASLFAPDMVVFTGDFVSRRVMYAVEDFTTAFAHFNPPDGMFAVLGNHDYDVHEAAIRLREMLAAANICELRNAVHTLRRGDAVLHLAGVDDVVARQARLDAVLDVLPADGCAILLAHEPDFADISAPYNRFDVQLSGHTHGGQIRLPGLGSPVTPKHGRRYVVGWYKVKSMQLYVNCGIGTVSPRLRFNCPPEITVFTLRSAFSAAGG